MRLSPRIVLQRTPLIRLLDHLRKDDFYCILTHVNPDLDAISSLLTLLIVLVKKGYRVSAGLEDYPSHFDFLEGWELFHELSNLSLPTTYHVISLDCGSMDRVWPQEIVKNASSIINIDHHFDNPLFGSVNICDHHISSTAELLYILFKSDHIDLDSKTAGNIYAGILYDTGGFRYSNTKMGTFHTVSELIKYGINPSLLADRVFAKWDSKGFCALQLSLANVRYTEEEQILFSYVPYSDMVSNQLSTSDFDGVIDILRLNRNTKYSVLVREPEIGLFKGSVRAKEPYEIGEAIRELGGGGHKRAAGFTTTIFTIEKIETTILQTFKKLL
jgi:phosphoesterase RecJ-like protein